VKLSKPIACLLLSLCATALAACSGPEEGASVREVAEVDEERLVAAAGDVDDARLLAAAADGDDWLSYGRTYDEQRFSPLTAIDDSNVGRLGLAWSSDLDTARGQEATPIVVDGVLYVSTAW
jgi:glucose dehydrogenase